MLLEGVGRSAPALPFGSLCELQPLACQLLAQAFVLEIADAVRELLAFCRVCAEFLGTRMHCTRPRPMSIAQHRSELY
jgi:hypothetical protein